MCIENGCVCDPCLEKRLTARNANECLAAWGDWYTRDFPVVHEFVRRRLQRVDGIDLADDIVQEVFLIGYRLMTRLTYPQPGNNLCGLLIGVARNLVLQAARARHRWALPLDDGVVGAARELAVDDALLVADVRCKVLVLIREQTEFSRALLHALYVDQRSMRAVARDLHASESNVRLLAHRAVTRITRDLHRKFCTELSPKAVRLFLATIDWTYGDTWLPPNAPHQGALAAQNRTESKVA